MREVSLSGVRLLSDRQPERLRVDKHRSFAILAELDGDKAWVEDMGALNRWPRRTGVPVAKYISLWQQSCAELGAGGRLPV
jgi:hypothetical protein